MNAQLALSLRLASAAVPALSLSSASAQAQAHPGKPIRMIVPFAAGGVIDITARAVGERLGSSLGQLVIADTLGDRGGDFSTRKPNALIDSSRCWAK